MGCLLQSGVESRAGHQLGLTGLIGIQHKIGTLQQRGFMTIEDPPLHKECPFVTAQHVFVHIIHPPVAQFAATETLLYFPAGHIGIHQHIGFGDQRRARPVNHHQPTVYARNLIAQLLDALGIKKLGHFMARQHAKHTVIR
ncbi:hypothetical protein D3C73_799630 [compost metagenome]